MITSLGTLYIVSTPIGNLSDLTYRAQEILSSVDLIAAEDTRVSRKLLNYYKIDYSSMLSYHDKNEEYQSEKLLGRLILGENIGLISDAGTPCISDPGYRLVNLARKKNIL